VARNRANTGEPAGEGWRGAGVRHGFRRPVPQLGARLCVPIRANGAVVAALFLRRLRPSDLSAYCRWESVAPAGGGNGTRPARSGSGGSSGTRGAVGTHGDMGSGGHDGHGGRATMAIPFRRSRRLGRSQPGEPASRNHPHRLCCKAAVRPRHSPRPKRDITVGDRGGERTSPGVTRRTFDT
jgi:hypothetical protein